MAIQVMLSQTSATGPGANVSFPSSNPVRVIQFAPQLSTGFTGAVVIEGTYAASPGVNDFQQLAVVTFTGHTANLSLDIESNAPTIRARVSASSVGTIAVYGDSRPGSASGSIGGNPATAVVTSNLIAYGNGSGFRVNAPVVPAITSDDVNLSTNPGVRMTDYIEGLNGQTGLQPKIGNGQVTANQNDVNVLTGTAVYGLTVDDMKKLSDVNASAAQLNHSIGVTGPIQTQINALSSGKADTSVVPANKAWVDGFFDEAPTVLVSQVNDILTGITASASDINKISGFTGVVADLNRVVGLTSSSSELNILDGATLSTAELNKLDGFTGNAADLNAIAGLGATTVNLTELNFLTGLSTNVQAKLDTITSFPGLTASVADINVLSGISAGTGAYSSPINATELSYVNGVTSSIQDQLDEKRSTNVQIGWSEIAGVTTTASEVNYLAGASSNIQNQINSLGSASLALSGGILTGAVRVVVGTAGAPSINFTGATTSGVYRFGSTGFGVSVAGSRAFTVDAGYAIVGDGVTNGGPTIRASSSLSDPAYSFTGDTDSGMYWISANRIGLAASATLMVSIDHSGAAGDIRLGTTADNTRVQIDGMFTGEKMLNPNTGTLIRAGQSGSTGDTTLYTVATGRKAVITKIVAVLELSAATFSDATAGTTANPMRLNIGISSGTKREIVDNTGHTNIFYPTAYAYTTTGQVLVLDDLEAVAGSSGAAYTMHSAGTQIVANLATKATNAAEYDIRFFVFGFEY